MRWLDPADQARLKGLRFTPRRAAAHAAGSHRSAARGFSREFDERRPYAAGDEARSIDWKAYARLDRWYVRQNRAEVRARVVVAVDATASMSYAGAGRPPKLDAARRAAAALAWLALSRGDEAGLALIGAAGGVPARGGAAHLEAIDRALDEIRPGADPDLGSALAAAAAELPARAAVVLISDLMGETAAVLRGLRRLAAGRRELRVLRVLDSDEREFPFSGPLLALGLEGGRVSLDADAAGSAYRAAFAAQAEAYRAALRRAGARLSETEGDWTRALARLLAP